MNPLLVVALNGFREARRNRVTLLGAGFAAAMLFIGSLIADSVSTVFDRVLTDVGLGLMSMMLAGLSIFLGASALPDDLDRRSMFLVITRPLSRTQYLLGRVGGNLITLGVLLLAMTLLFLGELYLSGAAFRQAIWASLGGLAVELIVLTAFAFLFTSFSSKAIAAMCTIGIYFVGHLSADLYRSAQTASPGLRAIATAVYYVLPNLERLNWRNHAAHDVAVPWPDFTAGAASGLAFAVICLVLATAIFERRDFR
jgi:Cu-processing system permease protein